MQEVLSSCGHDEGVQAVAVNNLVCQQMITTDADEGRRVVLAALKQFESLFEKVWPRRSASQPCFCSFLSWCTSG